MFLAPSPGPLSEPLTGRRWDPAQIESQVARRAAAFRARGVAPGERVFLGFGNRLEFFGDLLAIWRIGACAVPLDARLTPFEIETLAQAARPGAYVAPGELDARLAAALRGLGAVLFDSLEVGDLSSSEPGAAGAFSLEDDALILFTSGTTGNPKGVVHTHRTLRARWVTLRQSLGLEKHRRSLCLLPTHFGHGLICNSLFPWLSGQELFILPPFSSEVVMHLGEIVDENGITFLSSVPSVWRLALKLARPPRAGSLERVFVGSAPLSAHLWRQIQEWSGTREVCNAYGITETGSWTAGTTIPDFEPEDGLIGVPWGAVVAVTRGGAVEEPPGIGAPAGPGDTGFVWLNTPALMKGYLGRDDLTARSVRAGWFLTGDLGYLDARGHLYLRGRVRDEINKGGAKIYPADIESVAERFAGVADCCCFPIEDPLYGQNVALALVMPGQTPASIRGLHAWLKRHLAEHQMPVRWYRLDELPRTSRGKINRDQIAAACQGLSPLDLRAILAAAP
ncbi:MAG: AMP-binding protein [Acidobacteriota bacterium]